MDDKKSKDNVFTIVKIVFLVMLTGVFLYLILGEILLPRDVSPGKEWCEEFEAEWILIREDGSTTEVEIPGRCDAERQEVITVQTTLPEISEHDTCMCIRSLKQEMKIYVDGELRESYSTKNARWFGKTSAVANVYLELTPEDSGKTLRIQTQTDTDYTGVFYPVYIGSTMGIWKDIFKRSGGELVVAFFTLFLGLASIICGIALKTCYHRQNELDYLGLGVFLAAVWLITNSPFRQVIFPNISIINDIPFFMIMLMPMPFLIFMNSIQNGRYRRFYLILCVLIIVDFFVCTTSHVAGWVDFADTIVLMSGVCLLFIVLMGATVIMDIAGHNLKEYPWVAVGLLGASVAACIQIVLYFQRTIPFNGIILSLGLVFLLLMAVVNTVQSIIFIDKEKQKAVLASEAKARFLANMSHEIRTPINAVLGMNTMILRESKDAEIKGYAMDIQNAGQSLLALINDILDFSKIESGKMELIPAEYDFSSMIHDISNMMTMKAENKGLQMNIHVDRELPSRLFGDEIRIRQILINLLNNAVKYTNEGSVTLDITGTARDDTVILNFVVEDTGTGIKSEDIPKLFAAFERIEEKRNRNIEGTGLGMSIVVQLLDLMGSVLHVESEYGKGSRFSFSLKQKIMCEEPIGNLEERIRKQATEYSHEALFTAPKARILVVDDNAVNRKVFVNLLKETKIRVEEACGGEECLEKVFSKHYDVIFMDHMMPDMDGVETLHRLRDNHEHPCQDTPVIVLTANAISGAKEMYLAEGFDGFLSKPVIPEKLEMLIRNLLPKELLSTESDGQNHGMQMIGLDKQHRSGDKELPLIDGVDWDYALMHFPNKEFLLEAMEDFYQELMPDADNLEEAFRKMKENHQDMESLEQYRIKVHSMKSAAALVGILPLSGVAKMLENAAHDRNYEVIRTMTIPFLAEWRSYKEKLKVCIPDKEEKTVLEDRNILRGYLEILKTAIEDFDTDKADEVMENLRRYEFDEEIKEQMEQLDRAVKNLDSEQALTIIEKISL
ncbi:MAG: response regulator [Thermoflexaceae bacterium]|nr:response regulator [Thermoflexaceae bacterium]